MKPKPRPKSSQLDSFQAQLEQLLNHDHLLFVLANLIDWKRFDAVLADCYSVDIGAPAKAIRLLVGLHYLKHAFNESDESLLERCVENPNWQYFCGFETMQHEVPLHSTFLTKWRQRVGVDKLAEMLHETIALAVREKQVTKQELAQVNARLYQVAAKTSAEISTPNDHQDQIFKEQKRRSSFFTLRGRQKISANAEAVGAVQGVVWASLRQTGTKDD